MICYTANVARVITLKQEDVKPAATALQNALRRLQEELDNATETNVAALLAERTSLNELLIAVGG